MKQQLLNQFGLKLQGLQFISIFGDFISIFFWSGWAGECRFFFKGVHNLWHAS